MLADHGPQPGQRADLRRARGSAHRPGGPRRLSRRRGRPVDPASDRGRSRPRPCRPAIGDAHAGADRAAGAVGRLQVAARADRHHGRLRRRGHPQAGLARRPARQHHLRGRSQRRGEVDADGDDQRPAASARGRDPFRWRADLGTQPEADPGPGHRPDPAGAQPVRRHDRARERGDGSVHGQRQRARPQAPGRGTRSSTRSSRTGPTRRPAACRAASSDWWSSRAA